ncbi:hypothetical protein, partial [Mycobacterium tuberculosis]
MGVPPACGGRSDEVGVPPACGGAAQMSTAGDDAVGVP